MFEKEKLEDCNTVRIFNVDEVLLFLLKQIVENGNATDTTYDMIKRLEEGESLWHTLF